jgi:hypothetical protein
MAQQKQEAARDALRTSKSNMMLPPSSISRMGGAMGGAGTGGGGFGSPGGNGSQSPGRGSNFDSMNFSDKFAGLNFSSANISEVTPDSRSEYNGGVPGEYNGRPLQVDHRLTPG